MSTAVSFAAAAIIAVLPAADVLSRQTPAQTFQLVSIRKAVPGVFADQDPAGGVPSVSVLPDGRFEARRQSLLELAGIAYGFDLSDATRGVVETPAMPWAYRDRFDIDATAEGEWTTPPAGTTIPVELRIMLRAMLEDRFMLRTRVETKRVDVHALRLASRTGELGPWLRPSSRDCPQPPAKQSPPGTSSDEAACAFRLDRNGASAEGVTMTGVIRIVSSLAGVGGPFHPPVVDQTGLEGRYDVRVAIGLGRRDLALEPAEIERRAFDVARIMTAERRPIAVREAIAQQLGLTLEPDRLSVPTLIIWRARQPRED